MVILVRPTEVPPPLTGPNVLDALRASIVKASMVKASMAKASMVSEPKSEGRVS